MFNNYDEAFLIEDGWPEENEIITDADRKLADEIFELIQSLIEDDELREEYISKNILARDFNKHCLVNNNVSTWTSVKYDFKNIDKFRVYENEINELVVSSHNIISTLLDADKILSSFRKLFAQKFSILFTIFCEFHNKQGNVKIGLNNSGSDKTTNYLNNTINLMILSERNKTISMYPVDFYYLETKFNNIIKNHSNNPEISFHFNK